MLDKGQGGCYASYVSTTTKEDKVDSHKQAVIGAGLAGSVRGILDTANALTKEQVLARLNLAIEKYDRGEVY